MISHITERFRKAFSILPKEIQVQAKEVYEQFMRDPFYPSLHFKRVHSTKPVYSARINIEYRAIGIQNENEMVWFWIGSHNEYDKLLSRM
jgi:hypothetical protein